MNYGKRTKINSRISFDRAVAALSRPVCLDDMDIDERDSMIPTSDSMDNSSYDVEGFIYRLSYEELVVLLFRSFGSEVKDIALVLGSSPSHVYKIVDDLEKRANVEYNY